MRCACYHPNSPSLALPAGEDGCVAAYDAQRAYLPTAYLVAGFPLHASCMAVSTDGRLLAVAALSMTASTAQPSSGRKTDAGVAAAARAQPVLVLFDTLTLQPMLQIAVAGSSPVVQVQLLDSHHVLAATADGRLRGYSCSQGSLVVDVPRCLPGPPLCSALDPAGNFLVAGAAAGKLAVLGLHALGAMAAAAGDDPANSRRQGGDSTQQQPLGSMDGIITALPTQDVTAPPGTAVLGAVFAHAGRQLLTVGEGGEVCCWAFDGVACAAHTAGSRSPDASQTAVATQPQHAGHSSGSEQAAEPAAPAEVPDGGARPALRPVFNLVADGTAAAAEAPPCPPAGAGAACEAPRALPAAIRCRLRPRPPSAPLQLEFPAATAPALDAGTAARPQRTSTSLPATPLGRQSSGRRAAPFWERQGQPPEASLLISTAGGKRCAQVVRGEHRLVVTSPSKAAAAGGKGGQQRSAAWVAGEVAADRIPPYRPEQQLQLQPPAAAVRHLHGFEAAAGFEWMTAAEDEPARRRQPGAPQRQQFLFAAGNVLVAEDLAAAVGPQAGPQARQRHVARLPGRITALALSPASCLAAAAVEPVPGGGSADIHLVDVEAGEVVDVLPHHSYAVTVRKGKHGPGLAHAWVAECACSQPIILPLLLLLCRPLPLALMAACWPASAVAAAAVMAAAWRSGRSAPLAASLPPARSCLAR